MLPGIPPGGPQCPCPGVAGPPRPPVGGRLDLYDPDLLAVARRVADKAQLANHTVATFKSTG